MASKSVVDAVEAKLASDWSATVVIGLNGQTEPPADGSAFLSVQYPAAREEFVGMASVGSRIFRENGGVRFVLSVPRASGQGDALIWIETLRDLFRAQTLSGVVFHEASPAVTDDRNAKGNYWVMAFVVTYHFDAFK